MTRLRRTDEGSIDEWMPFRALRKPFRRGKAVADVSRSRFSQSGHTVISSRMLSVHNMSVKLSAQRPRGDERCGNNKATGGPSYFKPLH